MNPFLAGDFGKGSAFFGAKNATDQAEKKPKRFRRAFSLLFIFFLMPF